MGVLDDGERVTAANGSALWVLARGSCLQVRVRRNAAMASRVAGANMARMSANATPDAAHSAAIDVAISMFFFIFHTLPLHEVGQKADLDAVYPTDTFKP